MNIVCLIFGHTYEIGNNCICKRCKEEKHTFDRERHYMRKDDSLTQMIIKKCIHCKNYFVHAYDAYTGMVYGDGEVSESQINKTLENWGYKEKIN